MRDREERLTDSEQDVIAGVLAGAVEQLGCFQLVVAGARVRECTTGVHWLFSSVQVGYVLRLAVDRWTDFGILAISGVVRVCA